jgi:putative lipoic acid-binding regulatory protein
MRVFDRVVDFPCIFTVKVIGQPDETFDKDMMKMVGEVRSCSPHVYQPTRPHALTSHGLLPPSP